MRRLPIISASKLPLLALCAYSATEAAASLPQGESGEAAVMGNAKHGLIEDVLLGITTHDPKDVEMSGLDEAGVDAFCTNVCAWTMSIMSEAAFDSFKTEIAFAYDPRVDSARLLPSRHQRDYSAARVGEVVGERRGLDGAVSHVLARPGEIVGTADLVWTETDADGLVTLHVLDWKTGAAHHVEHPRENPQLFFLALCARRCAITVDRVKLWIAIVADDGTVKPQSADVSLEQLEAFVYDLSDILERIITSAPPVPGPHCTGKFCSLVTSCPAAVETVHDALAYLVPSLAKRHSAPLSPEPRSADDATFLLSVLPMLRGFVKRADAGLKKWADDNGGIEQRDGRKWIATVQEEEQLVLSPAAVDILKAELGEEQLAEALWLTKSAIERAAKAVAPPRKGPALGRRIIERLREVDAIKTKKITRYEAN